MQNNWANIDLKAMANSLRETIGNFGGFSPEQVRKSGTLNEASVRAGILRALENGSLTGHEILQAIALTSQSSMKPSASSVYPLLDLLHDQGLLSAKVKGERKIYTLTDAGREELVTANATPDTEGESQNSWPLPTWIDLKGEIPRAVVRLANVSMEVSRTGTMDQQKAAAAVIDEARRQLHEILATKK